jgi:hypothetical protein
MIRQSNSSPRTVAAYRDCFRLLFEFARDHVTGMRGFNRWFLGALVTLFLAGTPALATFRRKNEQSEADRALRPKSGIDKVLLSEAFS